LRRRRKEEGKGEKISDQEKKTKKEEKTLFQFLGSIFSQTSNFPGLLLLS